MKTLARISGLTVALAVCGLGTRGPALWWVVATGAFAMAALVFASGRLGYFNNGPLEDDDADVIDINGRVRARETRLSCDELTELRPQRSMNSVDQSSVSM
jgi:hypothetical protein